MIKLVTLAVLLAPPVPNPDPAWGWDAHRVICEIAYRRLVPEARSMVDDLMATDTLPSFAEACLWADNVRRTTHPETSAYHYVNIPSGSDGFRMDRDCSDPERRCVVWAIPHYAEILEDETAGGVQRLEALKFLAHFIGDLHQPMHAGRPEDLGGNRVDVEFPDAEGTGFIETNLHALWDYHMLERAGMVWPETAIEIDGEITPEQAEEWQTFDVIGWVNESFEAAETIGYDVGDGRITEDYQERAVAYSILAIERAAVRLAHTLNAIAQGGADFPTM